MKKGDDGNVTSPREGPYQRMVALGVHALALLPRQRMAGCGQQVGRRAAAWVHVRAPEQALRGAVALELVGARALNARRCAATLLEEDEVLVVLLLRHLNPDAPAEIVIPIGEGHGQHAADEPSPAVERAEILVVAGAPVAVQVAELEHGVGQAAADVRGQLFMPLAATAAAKTGALAGLARFGGRCCLACSGLADGGHGHGAAAAKPAG